jgi:2-oxoglutarate dehydrogenase E1 component
MEVCQPSTPAQVFHMLRRQAVRKSAQAADRHLAEVAAAPQGCRRRRSGRTERRRIPARDRRSRADQRQEGDPCRSSVPARSTTNCWLPVTRGRSHVAIVRLEQLYPFPQESFQEELAKYPKATEVVWCQEEPRNQGAWYWIASRQHLVTLAQRQAASPAGFPSGIGFPGGWLPSKHNAQQKALIESVLVRSSTTNCPRTERT